MQRKMATKKTFINAFLLTMRIQYSLMHSEFNELATSDSMIELTEWLKVTECETSAATTVRQINIIYLRSYRIQQVK